MNWKLWSEAREIAGRHARGDGDDLAQDLIVAALERGVAAKNPGAWLERVGRNAAIDRWRVQRRRDELATEIDLPAGPIDPEAALLGRERRGLVRRALAALPRPQRRAALARFHADLPYEEVAARVGAPAITARTRVHRALASLARAAGSAARDVRFSGRADERARAGVRRGAGAEADSGAGVVARRDLAGRAEGRTPLRAHAGDRRGISRRGRGAAADFGAQDRRLAGTSH